MFQFTLPRGERQLLGEAGGAELDVSIHAPAWGATPRRPPRKDHDNVSIHAPAWGATISTARAGVIFVFQFTLPRGERPILVDFSGVFPSGFNSRSRVGSDLL